MTPAEIALAHPGRPLAVVTELTQVEYRELRAERSEVSRGSHGSALYQFCERCRNCEIAGGFCSWCTTREYVLVAHRTTPAHAPPLRFLLPS